MPGLEEAMIERVARALYEHWAKSFAIPKKWDNAEGYSKTEFREIAVRAITAMREPTDAMLKPEGDELAYFDHHRNDDAASIWRRMIDVAFGAKHAGT